MFKQKLTTTLLLSILLLNFKIISNCQSNNIRIDNNYLEKENHTHFIENKGQVYNQNNYTQNKSVLFMLERPNLKLFLMENGLSIQFEKWNYPKGYENLIVEKNNNPEIDIKLKELSTQINLETWRMNMIILGANLSSSIITEEKSNDIIHYYNHNTLNVHHYKKITYKNIYPGIDWILYSNENGIKYEFFVHPGANPSMIKIKFTDYEEIDIDKVGNLYVSTPLGNYIEEAPVSYQENNVINTSFEKNNDIISFKLSEYNSNKPLVIDPLIKIWGSYYGGSVDDWGTGTATDSFRNIYLSGYTKSSNAIALNGYQVFYSGGTTVLGQGGGDAFLVKFNSDGIRQWATYYGGSNDDLCSSIAVDLLGNVYIAGQTSSVNNIGFNGFQNSIGGGGGTDAFLVKLDSNGLRQWATYYGGAGTEQAFSIATDLSGNIYMTGRTDGSATFIAYNGYQNSYGGGNWDAFIVKFNSSGSRQWATYYGGSGSDDGRSIAIDSSGNMYICGTTGSNNSISYNGHLNTGAGAFDAFLVKFNSNGVRQWATYYGGPSTESGFCTNVDKFGNVYLGGQTYSNTLIASNGHQNIFGGGTTDAFLVKFNSNGVRQWATYYGGTRNDCIQGNIIFDMLNNVIIGGYTNSQNSIVFNGLSPNTFRGGTVYGDAFMAKFNTNGIRQWATYYGGLDEDYSNSSCIDNFGNIYLVGSTKSTTTISLNGHQNVYGGGTIDAFIVKIADCTTIIDTLNITSCTDYLWSVNNQTYTQSGIYSDTLKTVSGCDSILRLFLTINQATSLLLSQTVCTSYTLNGQTYTQSGTFTQTLTNSTGCDSTITLNLTIRQPSSSTLTQSACSSFILNGQTYTQSGTFSQTLTNAAGCDSTITLNLTINQLTTSSITQSACSSFSLNGQTYTQSGTFTQILTNVAGCDSTITLNLNISTPPTDSVSISGNTLTAVATGASYQWLNCNNNLSPVSGATAQSYQPTASGSYAVSITDGACSVTSNCTNLTIVALNQQNASQIKIYPNPANDYFTIEAEPTFIGLNYKVIDVLGRELKSGKINNLVSIISIEDLSPGIYTIIGQNESFLYKLVKE